MGDRIKGLIECPYCGKKTSFWYAPSCNAFTDFCDYCKKEFLIDMNYNFVAKKITPKIKKQIKEMRV